RPGGDSVPEGRAYAPEGTEKKPIVFRSIGVMQRPHREIRSHYFSCLLPGTSIERNHKRNNRHPRRD
ncbi:MAG: hypothetical protein ACQEQO_11505, partial [Thermodesulfobacteriota bacterium]